MGAEGSKEAAPHQSPATQLPSVVRANVPESKLQAMRKFYDSKSEGGTWSRALFIKFCLGLDANSTAAEQLCVLFDADGDGTFSFEEYSTFSLLLLYGEREDRLRAAFSLMDKDKSGYLDIQEVAKLVNLSISLANDMHACLLHIAPVTEERIKNIFTATDSDQDGQISISEFLGSTRHELTRIADFFEYRKSGESAEDKQLAQAFKTLDRDGNGILDAAEFKEMLCSRGRKMSPEQVDRMIAEVDLDNDGVVNLEEFCHYMRTNC